MNRSALRGSLFFTCLLLAGLLWFAPPEARAQSDDVASFSLGNELLRQGEFEQAWDIFRVLLESNPRSYAVYDRAVSSLIGLRRFDDARQITYERLRAQGPEINTMVRLGEVYHASGEHEQALQAWERVIDLHADNIMAYRRVADVLNRRRYFLRAVEVYQSAQQALDDASLFALEIADNYLAAAELESAMEAYLDLLAMGEHYRVRIQRQLTSYDEQRLYDTAIVAAEQRLAGSLVPGGGRDLAYRDFLVWLYMERGLYRRALAAARTLERYSEHTHHAMFRLGRVFRSQQLFEFSEQAFTYYEDMPEHPLRARSMEELARTWQEWADHLVDTNRDFAGAADTLYKKAFARIDGLMSEYPRYEREIQTLRIQTELALDHLKDVDAARTYHERMVRVAASQEDEALVEYVEGRILLFDSDFSMARLALTRSNRLTESSDLANKTRYFLGLGDFYRGDFGYARLQFRALERDQYAWFANNALQMRYLLQEAYDQDAPEPNEALLQLARGRHLYDTGRYDQALQTLQPVIDAPGASLEQSEAALLMTRVLRRIDTPQAFEAINGFVERPAVLMHAGERLLWERARMADMVLLMATENAQHGGDGPGDSRASDHVQGDGVGTTHLGRDEVIGFYEEILLVYPDGFFADLSRERIAELERMPALET